MGTEGRGAVSKALAVAFVLSLAGAMVSCVAAGPTLGLLIGSVAFASLIGTPLALSVPRRLDRALVAATVTLANLVVWVFVLPIVDAFECAIVQFAFMLALVALRITSISIVVALVWLTLPIWTRSEPVGSLVAYHPIFTMNGACKTLGIWTQQPILYRLTTLGQDVPYELPVNIWRCVIAHSVIALLLLIPNRDRGTTAAGGGEPSDRRTTPTPPPAPQAARTP